MCLCNQALSGVQSTGAGIKCLYCKCVLQVGWTRQRRKWGISEIYLNRVTAQLYAIAPHGATMALST